MPGKEDYFLNFNKDEIFKNLIAVEGHFRNVKPGFESGDLACIVKHLADIEGHADEAISHSLIAEGKDVSAKYQQLRDMVREFRHKIQKNEITPEEGIKKTRELRAFFESFNPSYDVSKCTTCGDVEETIKKLNEILTKIEKPKTTLKDIEESMARRVIAALSQKYNVPPPKLEIVEDCHDPSFGLYIDGTIRVCRGGISAHVLAHEFAHYMQDKLGKPLDEVEAERFALEVINRKYTRKAYYRGSGDDKTVSLRDIAVIYGVQHVGKGITRVMEYLDAHYPGAVFGLDPSLIVDIIGAIGGILGGLCLKEPYDYLSVLIGGYLSTDLWRHAERMAVAPPAVAYLPRKPDWDSGWVELPVGSTEFTHNLGTTDLLCQVWIYNRPGGYIHEPYITTEGAFGWVSWLSENVIELTNTVSPTLARIRLWKLE